MTLGEARATIERVLDILRAPQEIDVEAVERALELNTRLKKQICRELGIPEVSSNFSPQLESRIILSAKAEEIHQELAELLKCARNNPVPIRAAPRHTTSTRRGFFVFINFLYPPQVLGILLG